MSEVTIYRVRQSRSHPDRSVRHAWYARTWQAEWSMCPWSPRAFTERGVRRRAERWRARGLDWQIANAHRRQWWRAHVTARSDPFYAGLRRSGAL